MLTYGVHQHNLCHKWKCGFFTRSSLELVTANRSLLLYNSSIIVHISSMINSLCDTLPVGRVRPYAPELDSTTVILVLRAHIMWGVPEVLD